jgi:hypothetical protein
MCRICQAFANKAKIHEDLLEAALWRFIGDAGAWPSYALRLQSARVVGQLQPEQDVVFGV